MGFRIRKRKRTSKNTWVNLFGSGKGYGASVSVRVGNATVNLGRNRIRSTFNFGNGVTYVSQRSLKKKEQAEPKRRKEKMYHSPVQEINEEGWMAEQMKKGLNGMTPEEYTAWYDTLTDEEKLVENKRVDDYLEKWNKKHAPRKRAYSPRYRKPKHNIIYRFFDHWLVNDVFNFIFALIMLAFTPGGFLIILIIWLFYGIWPS